MAAATGSPVGPVTLSGTRSKPAARTAARVPAPPSPTGTRTTSASGRARSSPASIARAACSAEDTAASGPLGAPSQPATLRGSRGGEAHGTPGKGAGTRRRGGGHRGHAAQGAAGSAGAPLAQPDQAPLARPGTLRRRPLRRAGADDLGRRAGQRPAVAVPAGGPARHPDRAVERAGGNHAGGP